MNATAKWAPLVLRVVMGVTFLFAAVAKFKDPAGFVAYVQGMKVLPEAVATVYGYAIPYLEIAVGVLLVLGLFARLAAWVGALLVVSFILGVGLATPQITLFMDPSGASIPSKDFAFLALNLGIAFLGAGALSLDSYWKR